ncbi:MAG: hypothetical protein RLZZ139_3819, partial [Cyanobacteriota bacterium]
LTDFGQVVISSFGQLREAVYALFSQVGSVGS